MWREHAKRSLRKQAVSAGIRLCPERGHGRGGLVFATEHTSNAGVGGRAFLDDRSCALMRMPPSLRAVEREAAVVPR